MKRDPHLWKDTYTYEKRPTMRTPMYGNRLIFTKRVARDWFTAWPIDWLRHWLYPWKETHMYEKRPAHTKRDLRIRKETCAYEKRLTMRIPVYGHRLMLTKIERGKVLIYCLTYWLVASLIVSMKRDLRIQKETFNADPHTWKQTDAYEKSPNDLLLLWLHSWKATLIHEKRPTGAQYTWFISFLEKEKKSSLFSL